MAFSADEFTIQTISALKEKSITPAFEKKVDKTAIPSVQKKEGACNIVTIGTYPTAQKAHADLSKAKTVAKDAFIRHVSRDTPKVCELKGDVHSIAKKDTNSSVGMTKKEETAAVITPKKEDTASIVAHSDIKEPTVAQGVIPSITPAAVATSEKGEAKAEPCKSDSCTNIYVYDRNLIRKSDISEAIEFYKNSPYYSFHPIALMH